MNNTFVAIDFETANPQRVSACSLGACLYVDGHLKESRYMLIKPVGEYAELNMRIHGITPEMTRDKPSFDELYPSIKDWFEKYPVVGYSKFDKSVFIALVDYYGLDFSNSSDYIDVCGLAKHAFPELKNHKLPTVAKHLGLEDFKHHDAAEDALKCAEIYVRMWNVKCQCSEKSHKKGKSERRQNQARPEHNFEESFSRYLLSIMSDGAVDYKEAYELQCVLQALSVDHPIFESLQTIVDDVLADGVITEEESSRMMIVLRGVSDLITKKAFSLCPLCANPLPTHVTDSGLEIACPWCGQTVSLAYNELDDERHDIGCR